MKIGRDDLVGRGDNTDGRRNKALHIRLDRTTVNRHVQKTERPVLIRDFCSGRLVTFTRQYYSGAFSGKCDPIGSRQAHGSNNRGARVGGCAD